MKNPGIKNGGFQSKYGPQIKEDIRYNTTLDLRYL